MIDDVIGFLFSALLGLVLLGVVLVLARRSMVQEMKKSREEEPNEKGEKEAEGQAGSSNQS